MAERSTRTAAAYARRFATLKAAAAAAAKTTEIGLADLVDWLVTVKRPAIRPASWRQYRAAVLAHLEWLSETDPSEAEQCAALARYLATPPADEGALPRRTSAQKAKRVETRDRQKIVAALSQSRSRHASAVVDFLVVNAVVGLRPVEWWGTRVVHFLDAPKGLMLRVPCAKVDDLRGLAETRTLFVDTPTDEWFDHLQRWMTRVEEAGSLTTYRSILAAMSALLRRVTRRLFPLRRSWPSLYSTRHEAAALMKAAYVRAEGADPDRGRAMVAALLGHATDESASTHYGRPHRSEGNSGPIVPSPAPTEVAVVRRKYRGYREATEHRPGGPRLRR